MTEDVGGGRLDFGMPMRSPAQGYLMFFFQALLQLGVIIQNMQTVTDRRLENYVRFLIGTIVDDEKRGVALRLLDERIKERTKRLNTNEEIGEAANRAALETLGDITAWYDENMGITHRLAVGVIGYPLPDNVTKDFDFDKLMEEMDATINAQEQNGRDDRKAAGTPAV